MLGVSRAAVWKQLGVLRDQGVSIEAVPGRGYRLLQAVELLEESAILREMTPASRQRLSALEIHSELSSTNTHLRRRAMDGAPSATACLAEWQNCGRGRRGREWYSPFGGNICLSLLWRMTTGAAALAGLSLAVGIAVRRGLQDFGVAGTGLKWPNDVIADGAKIAGVLIEVGGEATGPCYVVIGVGVNVHLPEDANSRIDQPWVDFRTLQGTERIRRNRLAAQLLEHLLRAIPDYESSGLEPFLGEWHEHDITAGRQLRILLPDGEVTGTGAGVDSSGALLLQTALGLRSFSTGEVSLRITS